MPAINHKYLQKTSKLLRGMHLFTDWKSGKKGLDSNANIPFFHPSGGHP
jgi:hypothetical protein